MAQGPSEIEKHNLEAHVELCAERYKSLEDKLNRVHARLEDLESHVISIRDSLSNKTANISSGINKQIIAIGTSIIGVLLAANVTLIVNLINK